MYLLYKLPFYQSLNYFRALYYYITYTLNQIKSRICLWTLKRDQVWPRCALFARRQFRPQRPNYSIKTMEQLKLSATIIVIVQLLLNRLDFVGRFLVFRTSDFGTGVLRCIRDMGYAVFFGLRPRRTAGCWTSGGISFIQSWRFESVYRLFTHEFQQCSIPMKTEYWIRSKSMKYDLFDKFVFRYELRSSFNNVCNEDL